PEGGTAHRSERAVHGGDGGKGLDGRAAVAPGAGVARVPRTVLLSDLQLRECGGGRAGARPEPHVWMGAADSLRSVDDPAVLVFRLVVCGIRLPVHDAARA